MSKQFYGEYNSLEAGTYEAVITQVVCLGHQDFKGTARTKFWIGLDIEGIGERSLSNFGIQSWLSPSKHPYVGFYELICAVLDNPAPSADELKEFDFFSLAGKNITVTYENVGGYMNITGIGRSMGIFKSDKEIITISTDEYDNDELIRKLDVKASNMIYQSTEMTDILSKAPKSEGEDIVSVDSIPF